MSMVPYAEAILRIIRNDYMPSGDHRYIDSKQVMLEICREIEQGMNGMDDLHDFPVLVGLTKACQYMADAPEVETC